MSNEFIGPEQLRLPLEGLNYQLNLLALCAKFSNEVFNTLLAKGFKIVRQLIEPDSRFTFSDSTGASQFAELDHPARTIPRQACNNDSWRALLVGVFFCIRTDLNLLSP